VNRYSKKFKFLCQRRGQTVTYVYKGPDPPLVDGWPNPDSPAVTPVTVQHKVFIQPPRSPIVSDVAPIGNIDVDDWYCASPYDVEYGEDFLHLEWDGSKWTVEPRDAYYIGDELVYKLCVVKRQTPGNSEA
jgi:hypothetical protein